MASENTLSGRLAKSTQRRYKSKALRLRKNLYNLTDQEVNALRRAFEGLYAISAENLADERGYQWIAGVHGQPLPIYCQHGNLNFTTWHRPYVYEFELRLQDVVPSVMMPYWDWASDRAIAEGIPAVLADPTYVDLETGETKPNPLASAFSQVTGRDTRRFPGDPADLADLRIQVEDALSFDDFADFSPSLENPHGGLHVWVGGSGGDMSRVPIAAYDPIFWFHHCNVDRIWWEWQQRYGNDSVPDAQRAFVCTPFNFVGEQTLDVADFGYSYAEFESIATPADAEPVPDTEAPLPPTMRFDLGHIAPEFGSAALEFIGLAKTEESYQLRIFCDSAAADGAYTRDSRRAGNPAYANTLYLFGHGECAGGVDHCKIKARPWFDLRPPHHLLRYNTFVDVTKAVKASLANGIGSLSLVFVLLDEAGHQVPTSRVDFEAISLVTYR
jgi:tyrosinase